MTASLVLALDVAADAQRITEILTTTAGQQGFWTADCDVAPDKARFGFAAAPVDLEVAVTTEPGTHVRMTVTSGFPFWEGSTWEWQLGPAARAESGTGVVFRHHGFADGYPEADLGYTAQTWAMVLQRLAQFAESGVPQPYFPAEA